MARARNIKPSFFTNEQLADNDPLGRLLFIGLWTLADYNGNLEWKERTIKIQILPWDDCSVKELAINLDKSGLVRFYSCKDKVYINITNFTKHQNPHINERKNESLLPEFSEKSRQVIDFKTLTINPEHSRQEQYQHQSDPADSLFLIPDSPFPLPDSLNLIPESLNVSDGVENTPHPVQKISSIPKNKNKDLSPSHETWQSYSDAYQNRYGVTPVRNATVNAQLSSFIKRIGFDESPHVAAFYVYHNNQFYVTKMHTVGLLLADAEKLRTEWATKTTVTQTQARHADETQARGNVWSKLIEEFKENGTI